MAPSADPGLHTTARAPTAFHRSSYFAGEFRHTRRTRRALGVASDSRVRCRQSRLSKKTGASGIACRAICWITPDGSRHWRPSGGFAGGPCARVVRASAVRDWANGLPSQITAKHRQNPCESGPRSGPNAAPAKGRRKPNRGALVSGPVRAMVRPPSTQDCLRGRALPLAPGPSFRAARSIAP